MKLIKANKLLVRNRENCSYFCYEIIDPRWIMDDKLLGENGFYRDIKRIDKNIIKILDKYKISYEITNTGYNDKLYISLNSLEILP